MYSLQWWPNQEFALNANREKIQLQTTNTHWVFHSNWLQKKNETQLVLLFKLVAVSLETTKKNTDDNHL